MCDFIQGLVSTIIPVYNRAGMIGASVQSVLDQTYRPIEIILVDDGSTDDTLAELNRLAEAHPDIIRVANRENGGPGLARETGRLLAKGEFIQYLDSDDLLLPRKYEVQVAALREHPECGIAYGITRLTDFSGNVLSEKSKWTARQYDYLFPALLVDRWWHTHTPLFRRELCDQIGPWPAWRNEDWEYEARAGALRSRLIWCNEPVSVHRHHTGHRVTDRAPSGYILHEAWLVKRLFICATQAGVPAACPEMKHFVRWAFSLARRLGAAGHMEEAAKLYDVARQASDTKPSLDIRLVGWLAKIAGWKAIGAFEPFYSLCRRCTGARYTMPNSWKTQPARE